MVLGHYSQARWEGVPIAFHSVFNCGDTFFLPALRRRNIWLIASFYFYLRLLYLRFSFYIIFVSDDQS